MGSGNVMAAWRILHYLTVRGQWPSWTVAKSGLDTLYVHAMNSILKRYILYMSAGGNFTGFEKSPDWIFPQMQKKHFLSRGPTPYLLVSHALAHSYAYASLITLSKSIPDIFRPISRQQVFSVHLFQSLEICFEFQCTYCCLYFMTKSGSRDRS